MSHGGGTQARKKGGRTDEMRDAAPREEKKKGRREEAEGEFQQDDIKNAGTQRGETDGDTGSRGGRQGEHGGERKNKGFGKQQLREDEGERKKEPVADETGLTLN